MRQWGLIALLAIAIGGTIGGCRTHTVDVCLPACDASDQTFFAQCVASGTAGQCQAGNRRCCALAAECIGDLDDQSVVTTLTGCMAIPRTECFPPCTAGDESGYEQCLLGGASCAMDDETCCALAANCLGDLGDVTVSADGCCATDADCPGQVCDPMLYTCMSTTSTTCGDDMHQPSEECDDGNVVTESCTYGDRSCTVCDATCHSVAGAVHFCGDGVTDLTDNETCDPPGTRTCDSMCRTIATDPCMNGTRDGAETDIDCGGGTCPACLSGEGCSLPTDCQSDHPDCSGFADCAAGLCTDMTACDDDNRCTSDACGITGGCMSTMIDRDGDGEGPFSLGCGRDCNDHDATIHTGAAELCDGIDQDCDDMFDESCT